MNKRLVLAVVLMAVCALSRWPGLMPLNFSATYALVFCAGLYVPGIWGWIIPFCLMVGSDLLLTLFFYSHGDFSLGTFLVDQAPNYLAYLGIIALGRAFRGKRPLWMLVGGGILGAILFYFVTNTAAWLTIPAYAKTFAGWIQAVTIGLPGFPHTWEFFRNTFLSSGLFTGLFAGAMKLTAESESEEAEEKETEKEETGDAPEAEPAKAES